MTDSNWDASKKVTSGNFDIPSIEIVTPAHPKVWKNPVFILLGGALTVALLALVAVSFALFSVNHQNTDLQSQLKCRAAPAVIVDQKTAEDLAVLSDAHATELQALAAIQANDNAALAAAVVDVPQQVKDLHAGSAALNQAVEDRSTSLKTCQ